MPFRLVEAKLNKAGFRIVSSKGSHVKFSRETTEGIRTAVVPRHREVTAGTLRSILRQAGIAEAEFEAL